MPIIEGQLNLYTEVEDIQFPGVTEFIANTKTIQNHQAIFPLQTNFTANPKTYLSVETKLNIILEVIPSVAQNYYQQYEFRLLVDGSEIGIQSFNLDGNETTIGTNLTVTLSNPEDRGLITLDKEYELQIGVVDIPTQVVTWYTVLDLGRLEGGDFSLSWNDNSPGDTVNFNSSSQVDTRLEKAPILNTVFYDSSRLSLEIKDFEKVYDTNGKQYLTDLIPIGNMTLYTLFDRIYVSRCGFSEVVTNIPNYQIRRVDIGIGTSYNQSLAPYIGMFEPVIFSIGDVLWVISTVQTLPDDFPLPLAINIDEYQLLQASYDYKKIGGISLDYIENDLERMFRVNRVETETINEGELGTESYTSTDIEETWYDYYLTSRPDILVKSVLGSREETIHDWTLQIIYEDSIQYRYDAFGREVSSTQEIVSRVPTLADSSTYALQTIKDVETNNFYRAHPYRPAEQILAKTYRRVRGLMAIDTENQYFDQDFKQQAIDSHLSGTLTPEMTYEYGDIETVTETMQFLPNKMTRVQTRRVDHVRNIVDVNYTEPRPGENTIGNSSSAKPIIVIPEGTTILSGDPLETFSIGEVPLEIGIPLVKQILKRRQEKPYSFNVQFQGFVNGLRRGIPYSLLDRSAELIGALIVEGFNVKGSRTTYVTIDTNIRGRQI